MRVKTGRAISLLAVCCLLLSAARASAGCASDERTLYLPAPQGDQIERLVTPLLDPWRQLMQQKVIPRFLPGRGGNYAWGRLALDKPNGCSFALVRFPSFLFLADTADTMYRKDDLTLVSVFASAPNTLWVSETGPFQTLADLVAHVKKTNDTPGGYAFFAGCGSYTDQHLATLQFNRASGVKASYLPVTGSPQATEAVADQKADACWGYALPPESMPGMRALAVAAPERSPALPDVPTFRELQLELLNISYFGISLPSATPREDQQELFLTIETLLADAALQSALRSQGFSFITIPREQVPIFIGKQQQSAASLREDFTLIPKDLARPPEPFRPHP